ncbi:MAG: hypothetical protein H7831_16285 [Magnetococcus sp. WYHC-3]
MPGTRQIVLHISPELIGRMEARAAAEQFDMHEWLLRTVIGELLRPESELITERRARTDIAALVFDRPTTERKPHAPHS